MKTQLEQDDIEAIANRVIELIKPLFSTRNNKVEDVIYTPETLAEYLLQYSKNGNINTGWVYKQVALKAIPFFKTGKYLRFRKSHIDKWIEDETLKKPVPSESTLKIIKRT